MISIEKVSSKQDLKAFINFPSTLFAGDENWIDPLFVEREEHLSKKNPASDHVVWQAWLAKRGAEVVGRITAQIDSLHRELYGPNTGHFGMIDAIDDEEVFAALFKTAEEWLISQGAHQITGPFSLNINQESGLLVDGFDTPPSALMTHAKPWYGKHIENLGYSKAIDLIAYWMKRTDLHFEPGLTKLMDNVRKRVTIRPLNRKIFDQEMQILRNLFNLGWQDNWGFVPFTEHEFATMGQQLKYLVPDDMIYIAEIDGEPAAFIVGLPNINEAIDGLEGKLLPFGWAKVLWRLKVRGVRTARVPLMGVKKEYQFSRIGPIIALLLIEALREPFRRRNIDALEMSWILETNTGMRTILERIGAEPYKNYRLFEKKI
ncbi:N-acetyltransferase [Rosenbergiella nectarea]|uniref:N-acetyltransferase n=1 Tax=Rosenbergiella nectarea TaxID=988801 RepID=UPI001F4EFFCB|nr:N-acetyltransferase [Rosenbergiella nectarea]